MNNRLEKISEIIKQQVKKFPENSIEGRFTRISNILRRDQAVSEKTEKKFERAYETLIESIKNSWRCFEGIEVIKNTMVTEVSIDYSYSSEEYSRDSLDNLTIKEKLISTINRIEFRINKYSYTNFFVDFITFEEPKYRKERSIRIKIPDTDYPPAFICFDAETSEWYYEKDNPSANGINPSSRKIRVDLTELTFLDLVEMLIQDKPKNLWGLAR